jgi:UDP-N-acetylglucosamine 2-epimerase (non-hydrolysing)
MRGPRSKVVIVYGTRPEAIKLAPVVRELRRRPDAFEVVVCATAQHRELLDQAQELFGLRSDHDLDLMTPGQSLNQLAARALARLDRLLAEISPDWLLVQGDTTSAAAAALAAFHLGLRIGHVEAGLRTGDLARPFPEEANRRIVDLLAGALFAPTALAARRLRLEGADPARIFLTGNTGIDALHWMAARQDAEAPAAGSRAGERPAGGKDGEAEVLVTVHRRESFGAPLRAILGAIASLAKAFPRVRWTFPVHPNPLVAGPAAALLQGLPNLRLCPPLAYDELVRQLRRAALVLTDSGGLQEEAPAFGKPVLVLRDATERPEGIAAGVARLVGTDPRRIVAEAARLLTDPEAHGRMARVANPYGDGRAAHRIAAILAGEPYTPFAARHTKAAAAGVAAAARVGSPKGGRRPAGGPEGAPAGCRLSE